MDLFRPNDSFVSRCSLKQAENSDGLRFGLIGVAGTIIAMVYILEII